KLYADADVQLLVNAQATPEEILKRLKTFADKVEPDDRFVLALAGHGVSAEELSGLIKQKNKQGIVDTLAPGSFAFLGPLFDLARPNSTCLTSHDLYDAIISLPCRKLVLLDACHSGTVSISPVRELTRDGVGPVILAACEPNEQA